MRITFTILFFFLLFQKNNILAQDFSKKNHFFNCSKNFSDSIKNLDQKSVLFFCPTLSIDSTNFIRKGQELIENKKISDLDNVNIYFLYFKENPKNNSKGLVLSSKNLKESFPVGQFECLFVNFNKKHVSHAKENLNHNFEIIPIFQNENIIRVSIVDTNKCFKEIPDRIPYYADFIRESILPNFTTDEKLSQLIEEYSEMKIELSLMKKRIEQLTEQNEKSAKRDEEMTKRMDTVILNNRLDEKPKIIKDKTRKTAESIPPEEDKKINNGGKK